MCVLWDRHDTWKLKTGSLSGIQRGTAGEKGKKTMRARAQWSGWREEGRKKQDETSESFHPARSENSFHQYDRQFICINLLQNTIELCCCISGLALEIRIAVPMAQSFINNLQYSLLPEKLFNCPCTSNDLFCRCYIQGGIERESGFKCTKCDVCFITHNLSI